MVQNFLKTHFIDIQMYFIFDKKNLKARETHNSFLKISHEMKTHLRTYISDATSSRDTF